MIVLMLGYFVMGLIFPVVRFFYRILQKNFSRNNLVRAVRNDFLILYAYAKQIIVSNPKKFKTVGAIMICLVILPLTPLQIEIEYIIEDFLAAIMFFLLVVVFAPQENSSDEKFPVEIFGFIYSIIFMYHSAGNLVLDTCYAMNWIFRRNAMA